jgi:hypothetical protein
VIYLFFLAVQLDVNARDKFHLLALIRKYKNVFTLEISPRRCTGIGMYTFSLISLKGKH